MSVASRLVVALIAGTLLTAAACGTTSTPGQPGQSAAVSSSAMVSDEPTASAGTAEPTETPSEGDESASPEVPSPDRSPSPDGSPPPEPSPSPAATPSAPQSVGPSPSPGSGPAGACTGNASNRDFFTSLAGNVAWDVYCAVLPSHWFVGAGTDRLVAGGRLEITYKGPAGARLTLREGAFCGTVGPCPPDGADSGAARFGGLDARLFVTTDGTSTIFAQDGELAWEIVGTGMDRSTLAAYAAALSLVAR